MQQALFSTKTFALAGRISFFRAALETITSCCWRFGGEPMVAHVTRTYLLATTCSLTVVMGFQKDHFARTLAHFLVNFLNDPNFGGWSIILCRGGIVRSGTQGRYSDRLGGLAIVDKKVALALAYSSTRSVENYRCAALRTVRKSNYYPIKFAANDVQKSEICSMSWIHIWKFIFGETDQHSVWSIFRQYRYAFRLSQSNKREECSVSWHGLSDFGQMQKKSGWRPRRWINWQKSNCPFTKKGSGG